VNYFAIKIANDDGGQNLIKLTLWFMPIDNYRHKGLRKKLIQSLRKKGITDERILRAMDAIPRHFFLDGAFEEWAYKDQAFPIACEQTISQPYTVAFQTQLLNIEKGDKVLEIGTGSGYQAAILDEMGAKVYTVERQSGLFEKTNELLDAIGKSSIRTFLRDGMQGLPRFVPFDKILVTAGAESVPAALLDQLKVGGILVIPVGVEDQQMYRIIKKGPEDYEKEIHGYFRFVPLLKGIENR
jgi:protein-L-isoaspartate(D-aspartate) O-methyltransferase